MDSATAEAPPETSMPFDVPRITAQIDALAVQNAGHQDVFRAAISKLMKAEMTQARADAQATLLKDRHGRHCAETLCEVQDDIIQMMFKAATKHLYNSPVPSSGERMAVVATGGYGRGLMAPESDIDLLFILPYKQTAWGEQVAEAILYCLWDMGLKVGHATRSVDECIRQARGDMTIRTAILEMRFLAGDQALFDELVDRFDREVVQGTAAEFVTAKLAEREERHRRAGQSRYLVEPNVKDGKGGLRDLHTLYWIAKYVYRVRDTRELVDHGVFDAQEYRTFRRCEDFLWSVRCNLHFVSGPRRGTGVVRLAARDRGAVRLYLASGDAGRRTLHEALFPGGEGRRRSHRDPVRQAGRPAGQARAGAEPDDVEAAAGPEAAPRARLRRFRHRQQPHQSRGPRCVQARPGQPHSFLPAGAEEQSGAASRCDADGHAVAAAHQYAASRRPRSQSVVHGDSHLRRRRDRAAADERDRRARPLHPRVRQDRLDDAIQHVPSLHCGRASLALRRLPAGDRTRRQRGVRRRQRSDAQDSSRTSRGDLHHHVAARHRQGPPRGSLDRRRESGTTVVSEARLQCRRYRIDRVADPGASDDVDGGAVARPVGPQDHREFRQCRAVGRADEVADDPDHRRYSRRRSGRLERLEAQLLRTLYYETEPVLTGGFSEVNRAKRIAAAQGEFRHAFTEWPEVELESYIARHYQAYWLKVDLAHKIRHARFLRASEDAGHKLAINVGFDGARAVTELTILAQDHPWLLSIIAGACASAGANIVDAQIYTTTDGKALDTIAISREYDRDEDEGRRATRIGDMIEQVLEGKLRLPEVVARRAQGAKGKLKPFVVEPEVIINNQWSDRYTVIEVSGLDRPGLLYQLTTSISKLNLNIASAHVATFGERARDVFYVTDLLGAQINAPTRQAAIKRALVHLLAHGEKSE